MVTSGECSCGRKLSVGKGGIFVVWQDEGIGLIAWKNLEWGFHGTLDIGHSDSFLVGKMSTESNSMEECSLSSSWGRRWPQTRGSREGRAREGEKNMHIYNGCVQEHMEFREDLEIMQRCIHQKQKEALEMQEKQIEKKECI